jgi:hypothetical protein
VGELVEVIPAVGELLDRLSSEQLDKRGRDAARQVLASMVWRVSAGGVLTTEQARRVLGVSRQALHKRVDVGGVLGLPGERTTLYPVWQFSGSEVRPVTGAIIRAFRERLDGEYDARLVSSWATTPQPDLHDATPEEWLAKDGDTDRLVIAAKRAADALARGATSTVFRFIAFTRTGSCTGSIVERMVRCSSQPRLHRGRAVDSTFRPTPVRGPATCPRRRSGPASRPSAACASFRRR